MKIKLKKQISWFLIVVAIIQIFLMINVDVAESYMINKIENIIEKTQVTTQKNDGIKSLIEKGIGFLVGFLSIEQIGTVSAQDIEQWCCPEMKDGNKCQDIVSERAGECKTPPIETKCDFTQECHIGCCVQPTGQCSVNSPKGLCIGGQWKEDETCSIPECQRGCCMATHELTTRKECVTISEQTQQVFEFKDTVTSEPECIGLRYTGAQGACVFEDKSCQRIPNTGISDAIACVDQGGKFSPGKLCSNPALETLCTRQSYTGCDPEGALDEIYWFDSCGNRENIYNSDKTASWNNGNILAKDSSCEARTGSINNYNCGNCDRLFNSVCSASTGTNKIKDGNFICKDLRCHYKDQWGNNITKNNGESWCVYDGSVGSVKSPWREGLNFSSDVVGSRHWLWSCVDGEISTKGCADGRTEICAESQTPIEDSSKKFSIASCIVNEGKMCLDYGPLQYQVGEGEDARLVNNETLIQACQNNTFCAIKHVKVDRYFKFDLCMPRYPFASNLSDGVDDGKCSIWDFKCTIGERKRGFGAWKCFQNCECKHEKFVQQLNDVCASWGDCGSKVNIVGKGTDNYIIKGKNDLDIVSECTSSNVCGQECKQDDHCYNPNGTLARGIDFKLPMFSDPFFTLPGQYYINTTGGWSCQNISGWNNVNNRYETRHLNCKGNNPLKLSPTEVEYLIQECPNAGTCSGGIFKIRPDLESKFSWKNYTKYATPVRGQFAQAPNQDEFLASIIGGGVPAVGTPAYSAYNERVWRYLSGISGATGGLIVALASHAPLVGGLGVLGQLSAGGTSYAMRALSATAPVTHFTWLTTVGTFATVFASFALGAWVGGKIAAAAGYGKTWGTILTISFGSGFAALAIWLVPGITANAWNVVGWILAAIAVIGSAVTFIFGYRYRTRESQFTCMPWEAPFGGADCSKCNQDPNKPCSKYRCESLGKACVFVSDNIENGPCDAITDDGRPPTITPIRINLGYNFSSITNSGVKIKRISGNTGCIPAFTKVNATFKTDEYARCNWSSEIAWPEVNMPNPFPVEGSGFIFNHTFEFKMPSIDMLNANDVQGDIRRWFGNMNFYMSCVDFWGRVQKYKVNLCVEQEDKDMVNHLFTVFVPKKDTKLKIGTTSVPIKMLINKPAECRYDTKPGTAYNSMPYNMTCKTGASDEESAMGGSGWPCTTNMTGLVEGPNSIYIRCKAQPYFEAMGRGAERKVNTQDEVYTLILTKDQLLIDRITFTAGEETVSAGGKFVQGGTDCFSSVNMQVITLGGVDDGISSCKWGTQQTGGRWPFEDETDGITHNQRLAPRCAGTHINYIDCVDSAGNTVTTVANFTLEIDTQPPKIIKNETIDGNTRLETDELATCYYNNLACRTNPTNQTNITGSGSGEDFETEHWIYDLSPRRDYYVTCKDVYNHTNSNCAIIISATERDDGTPPEATRVYNDAGNLKLVTSEEAKCSYKTNNCNFNVNNGTLMDGASGQEWSKEHTTLWNPKLTYHIKCKDSWENANLGCIIIVQPEEFYE